MPAALISQIAFYPQKDGGLINIGAFETAVHSANQVDVPSTGVE